MADDVFKALADPTRRRILNELTERNSQTLFKICARLTTRHGLGLSRQAVSQHLAVLEPNTTMNALPLTENEIPHMPGERQNHPWTCPTPGQNGLPHRGDMPVSQEVDKNSPSGA
ncbi:ArsR/SmtB family transcription factor [Streptomyces sp. MMBL 11-1]|uniref:ArsR/SmtB family transcription factor n=1 Tax=Streptomyces sp. MMBL 11-1 TaxID=3026420 RepID=UPI00235EEBD3|nr:helix-turn-helix domain-containing protein [Streptomyces sp. MMBL 11-1]